ncbi:MAG: helix-turn-helix transcriptional regulator [Candidatus Ancaeobacter aquaticus]|nr:helix-turn-helix transcriptional regulator [Candidatus Ancaeobacter aquaticus]
MEDSIKRLLDHRKEKELSQEDVAKQIGVSVFTISRWERGFNPSRLAKARIQEYLQKERN